MVVKHFQLLHRSHLLGAHGFNAAVQLAGDITHAIARNKQRQPLHFTG